MPITYEISPSTKALLLMVLKSQYSDVEFVKWDSKEGVYECRGTNRPYIKVPFGGVEGVLGYDFSQVSSCYRGFDYATTVNVPISLETILPSTHDDYYWDTSQNLLTHLEGVWKGL